MIPEKLKFGRIREFDIGMLLHHLEKHVQEVRVDDIRMYVCGYPVPKLVQRELCWSKEQKIAYIESIWLGLPLDPVCIHAEDWDKNNIPVPFSGWVLDGQNRIESIESYVKGQYAVYGLLYPDLPDKTKHRFCNSKLVHIEAEFWDLDKIQDFYQRKAYGGTPHL